MSSLNELLSRCCALLNTFKDSPATRDELLRLATDIDTLDDASKHADADSCLDRIVEVISPASTSTSVDFEERADSKDYDNHVALPLLSLGSALSRKTDRPSARRAEWLLTFARWFHSYGNPAPAQTAQELCRNLCSDPHRLSTLTIILTQHFPPLFKPHPKLSATTGRALNRPVGGKLGMSRYHEESLEGDRWRREAGLHNVVLFVIASLKPDEIRDLWHLVLPPLLAYLDDYEAPQKIRGLVLLDELLLKIDKGFLDRTGVGQVFTQSVESCLSNMEPNLLRRAHPTALRLVAVLHPSPSQARFDQLCAIFSKGIVDPWQFKDGQLDVELVVAQSLPPLLKQLGEAGVSRFLSIIVPHLCRVVSETPVTSDSKPLVDAALAALAETARRAPRRFLAHSEQLAVAAAKLRIRKSRAGGADALVEVSDRFEKMLSEFADAQVVQRTLKQVAEVAPEITV